jgi:hypothetical protein
VPFVIPQRSHRFDWCDPSFGSLLLSSHHGLLIWTPLYLLCFAGWLVLTSREPKLGGPLGAVVLFQIYVDASFDWSGGLSFGVRRLVDCTAIAVLCLATLVDAVRTRPRPLRWLLFGLISVAAAWTVGLIAAVQDGTLEAEGFVSLGEILHEQGDVWSHPFATAAHAFAATFGVDSGTPVWALVVLVLASFAVCVVLERSVARPTWLRGSNAHLITLVAALVMCTPFITVALQPVNPAPLMESGRRDLAERAQWLSDVVAESRATNLAAVRELAGVSFQLGRLDEAAELLMKCRESAPTDGGLLFDLGICHLNNERPRAAVACFEELLALEPNHEEAIYHAGVAYVEAGNFGAALPFFDRALTGPEARQAGRWHAYALLRLGRQAAAVSELRGLIDGHPGDASYRALLRRAERWSW